ncbi:TPA: hypothetical protein NKW06_002749 [Vibrio parahaemolyticus]|nr:hypothetical protein [Vibrio parahaemolyticus]HCM1281364.1 hypothetical protein [Vibrio parahaemolyticus]
MNVKPRSPLRHEYLWYQSLYEQGYSVEKILETAINRVSQRSGGEIQPLVVDEDEKKVWRLFIEHSLGMVNDEQIRSHCPPAIPQRIEYIKQVNEGYLARAVDAQSNDFLVLFNTQNLSADTGLSEDVIKNLISTHNEQLSLLAYKNAHEGNPYGYSGDKKGAVAQSGISFNEIRDLLPSNL